MPVNFNFDLTGRRKQKEIQDQLSQLRGTVFGQEASGPPTPQGVYPTTGGVLPPTPENQLYSQLLSNPTTADIGITGAIKAMERQRMEDESLKKQQALSQAYSMIPTDGFPGVQALVAMAKAGDPEAQKALADQLKPFSLSSGQERFTGLGTSIAIGPEDADKLNSERDKLFTQATKLRGEFTGITKPYEDQNQAYGRVIASAQDPSPAGDMALIFNYMKILDPGSTVREGEFANAQNSGSVPNKVGALYNSVVNGQRLTKAQRADFVNLASRLFEQASKQHKKTAGEFRALAIRNKIDPKDVVFQRQTIDVPPPLPPGAVLVP